MEGSTLASSPEPSGKSVGKRVAKNTLLLYIRMLVTMAINLYVVRITLNLLGTEDYGIYNVVGGIVTACSFISTTMASTSMRFFSYELGQKNAIKLKQTFGATVNIYLIFAILIILIAESIGLWFVSTQLVIPPNRLTAAHYVYQFSILGFIATVLRVPFNALIIARERMTFYAWLSIAEALLKLGMLALLLKLPIDSLILYSILMSLVLCLVTFIFFLYCRTQFAECRFSTIRDKRLYQSLLGFAGWNFFGSLANVGLDQGLNILLNIFFGAAINAARAIAMQIKNAVLAFVGNFQTASSPQIIKYYATGEIDKMKRLLFQSSKYSFYLLFIIALPIILEMDTILAIWLTSVPPYTLLFARLIIGLTLTDCLSGTIIPAVQATGRIRYYQISVCTIILLNVPIAYLFLKLGAPPESTVIISIILSCIALIMRLIVLKKLLNFPIIEYLKKVTLYDIKVAIVASILPLIIQHILPQGIWTFFIVIFVALLSTIITIYGLGLMKEERHYVNDLIKTKIIRHIWIKKS